MNKRVTTILFTISIILYFVFMTSLIVFSILTITNLFQQMYGMAWITLIPTLVSLLGMWYMDKLTDVLSTLIE